MTRCFRPFFSARPYPSDSAGIEGGEAQTVVLQMIEDDRRDQKPRYNEEDIDTDKATSKGVGEPVKNHDGHLRQWREDRRCRGLIDAQTRFAAAPSLDVCICFPHNPRLHKRNPKQISPDGMDF